VRTPGRATFLIASLAAILSVQTLYQNAFLVLAACVAGCAVCARHRQWKTAALVLGVGLLAAASLMPYVPLIIESQNWFVLQKTGFDFERAWSNLFLALRAPLDWPAWVWLGLLPFVFGAGWASLQQWTKGPRVGMEDLPLFGVSALLAGTALFFVFLCIAELPTEPWYFLPLMVFAAAAIERALADWCRQFRSWALVFIAVMACAPFPAALKFAQYRQTNVHVIAAEVQRRAQPGDLIVVFPCYCGITFGRYYRGLVAWTTLPPLEDHRFHRADLLKEKLRETRPAKPVLDRAARALASGHSLWMIGPLPEAQPGETEPPDLPPAPIPNEPRGWWEGHYSYVWGRQAAHLIASHAEHVEVVFNPPTSIVQYEELPLIVATGWHEAAATPAPPKDQLPR
jgi:hypothetical protein